MAKPRFNPASVAFWRASNWVLNLQGIMNVVTREVTYLEEFETPEVKMMGLGAPFGLEGNPS